MSRISEAVEGGAVETAAPRHSTLEAAHLRAGAVVREQDGCVVPSNFGDASAEYDVVRGGAGAGLFDLSSRGRVEVSGGEAVRFLNGMVTNDVARLEDGAWMHAAFPNPQGRLVATARILRHDEVFLIDTEAATHATVLKTLGRFVPAGDFRVRDLTAAEPLVATALLSLQGARASEIIGAALGEKAARVERGRAAIASAGWGYQPLIIIRATHTYEDGFDIFVSAATAPSVWQSLVDAGARPAGFDALEVLRVEAGVPLYGVDASDTNVVLEVVDETEAVSYTKGCYAGQEIIARIHWRGHVAKRLAGLVFDRDAEPPADSRIKSCAEDREIGRITSTAFSPRLRRQVALGLVKYDYLAPGTEVKIYNGDSEVCAAHVAELPLVRGSWYAGEVFEGAGGESA